MSLKKAKLEELSKKIVTFYENESKEVLKHTVNYFKKQNVPIGTIYNIVAKYRQRNSTSYLAKGGSTKKVSNQQLQTLVNLVNSKVGVNQRRLGHRFIHRSKIAVCEERYLKRCIRGRLLPFINKYHQNDKILF